MDKILIADDNKQHCELLKDILLGWGYEVYVVYSGIEAIATAEQKLPDLILLDVMLPGLNGFETCQKMKSHPDVRNIPILMQTVLNETDDRIRGYKVGASMFMTKPINYNELRHHIERLVKSKKTIEQQEDRYLVVRTLVRIIGELSPELYQHSEQVFFYCNKAANLLGMDEERKARLSAAAWLHDLGKLVPNSGDRHGAVGADMLQELHMSKWLNEYIAYHHEYSSGQGLPPNLPDDVWLLIAVNKFVHCLDKAGDPQKALEDLARQEDYKYIPAMVANALRQVVKDEIFVSKAFAQKQAVNN
jgi:putative two-component system response regulator